AYLASATFALFLGAPRGLCALECRRACGQSAGTTTWPAAGVAPRTDVRCRAVHRRFLSQRAHVTRNPGLRRDRAAALAVPEELQLALGLHPLDLVFGL